MHTVNSVRAPSVRKERLPLEGIKNRWARALVKRRTETFLSAFTPPQIEDLGLTRKNVEEAIALGLDLRGG